VRLSALIMLNENMLNLSVAPEDFLQAMIRYIPQEANHQLFALALGYADGCFGLFFNEKPSLDLEKALWNMAESDPRPERRSLALRIYCSVARTPEALDRLYSLWDDEKLARSHRLSETDLTTLSYMLAIRFPQRSAAIVAGQRARSQIPTVWRSMIT
jgi:aminopeptidase N